jgi:hypothetical protein
MTTSTSSSSTPTFVIHLLLQPVQDWQYEAVFILFISDVELNAIIPHIIPHRHVTLVISKAFSESQQRPSIDNTYIYSSTLALWFVDRPTRAQHKPNVVVLKQSTNKNTLFFLWLQGHVIWQKFSNVFLETSTPPPYFFGFLRNTGIGLLNYTAPHYRRRHYSQHNLFCHI